MLRYVHAATRWVGRHAFPALAAAVIAVGAVGGGIGYALAGQHTLAPAAATSGVTNKAPSSAKTGHRAGASAALLQRALGLIAAQTGQSVATVHSELAGGKSVNDVAGSKAPTIESAILAELTKVADRAVTAGKISSTQEASLLAAAKTRLDALMAEPGPQFLTGARSAFNLPHGHAAGPAVPTPSPSP